MRDYGVKLMNGLAQQTNCDIGLPIQIGTERSTMETMNITAEHLERIERRLAEISTVLFGSEPCEDNSAGGGELSVSSLAEVALTSSRIIEAQCDRILRRLAGGQ